MSSLSHKADKEEGLSTRKDFVCLTFPKWKERSILARSLSIEGCSLKSTRAFLLLRLPLTATLGDWAQSLLFCFAPQWAFAHHEMGPFLSDCTQGTTGCCFTSECTVRGQSSKLLPFSGCTVRYNRPIFLKYQGRKCCPEDKNAGRWYYMSWTASKGTSGKHLGEIRPRIFYLIFDLMTLPKQQGGIWNYSFDLAGS